MISNSPQECKCHCHPGSKFFGTKYTLKPKHMKSNYCEACKRGENCDHCSPSQKEAEEWEKRNK